MNHAEYEELAIRFADEATGGPTVRGPFYGQVKATIASTFATLALAAAIRESEPES